MLTRHHRNKIEMKKLLFTTLLSTLVCLSCHSDKVYFLTLYSIDPVTRMPTVHEQKLKFKDDTSAFKDAVKQYWSKKAASIAEIRNSNKSYPVPVNFILLNEYGNEVVLPKDLQEQLTSATVTQFRDRINYGPDTLDAYSKKNKEPDSLITIVAP